MIFHDEPQGAEPAREITALLHASADEFCDGPYACGGELGDHRSMLLWAADEITRLRELIRRALADGMGVLDESDYDLYGELSTYLGDMQ